MFLRTGIEPVTFRLYDNPLQPNVISNYTIEGLIAKNETVIASYVTRSYHLQPANTNEVYALSTLLLQLLTAALGLIQKYWYLFTK
ncbi:uncharacterized protein N7482_008369 [Penicillium canariense]|uniref:Uncharacterized protein n=1 Tax=Penicillium canariense TaxID=189055 RepID=A0A9W9HVM1_9EURO|nr:uncharacterized protein N7482_008369 [Penicillium canariense]KAJ5157269.1 hypothetical protein N7482_008369 [Penicillium canariense]